MTYGSEPIFYGVTFDYDEMVDIYHNILSCIQRILDSFLHAPFLVTDHLRDMSMKNIFRTLKRELEPLGWKVSYWGRKVTDSSTLCEIPFYDDKKVTMELVLKWFQEPWVLSAKEQFFMFAQKIQDQHLLNSTFYFQGAPIVF